MNWFRKTAKDFSERNHLNERIRYLLELQKELGRNSKLIFQSGKTAKDSTFDIITSKKITSYPLIHDLLIEANDVALDSPWKYQEICQQVMQDISLKIADLKEERRKFTDGVESSKVQKGWVNDRE